MIPPDIINNIGRCFSNILLTTLWYPLYFKAHEDVLSRRVVPTISTTAHTLSHIEPP